MTDSRFRPQFGIRTLLMLLSLCAIGVVIWQSIPMHGKPVLYGKIVDGCGKPIENVEIVLHSGLTTRFPNQTTKTNALGKFEFVPLETGSLLITEEGKFNAMFVGIKVSHPDYRALDGSTWWDISVPRIKNRRHQWNLVMTRIDIDNTILPETNRDVTNR